MMNYALLKLSLIVKSPKNLLNPVFPVRALTCFRENLVVRGSLWKKSKKGISLTLFTREFWGIYRDAIKKEATRKTIADIS